MRQTHPRSRRYVRPTLCMCTEVGTWRMQQTRPRSRRYVRPTLRMCTGVMTQYRCRAAWDSGMARRPLCAENVPQIEHFEILRPVCAQYTCITTRKTRVCLYTISLLQHTRIHAIYKQGTHTYAMSLIQNEEPRQAPQASVFPHSTPFYVAQSGGLQQYAMQQAPMHPLSGIHSESMFANNATQPTALCMQPQPAALCMQPQPPALCMQPQPPALCMQPPALCVQPLQMLQTKGLQNGSYFCVQ